MPSSAEHERVEQQHRDHRPRRVPVAAQIDDQPPALRDGEQHRVEREQESHERADRREQRGRLVARRGRLGEQPFFVVDRLDVQTPAGQPLERSSHLCLGAGGRLYEDAAHACAQAGHFLGERQRHDRHRAGGQRPDLARVQLGVQRRLARVSVELQRRLPGRTSARRSCAPAERAARPHRSPRTA